MQPLEPDCFFHVFNRANGNELLFSSTDNYHYFLKRYSYFISPIADTYCYCLMPNHFHFLIQIKGEEELGKLCQGSKPLTELNAKEVLNFLSRQFSHLLNGYTQAFNKQEKRKGSLFMRPFKRKKITDEKYLHKVVHYIHYNPVDAGLCDKPEQ